MTYEDKRFYIDRVRYLAGEAMRTAVLAADQATAVAHVFTDAELLRLDNVQEKVCDALARVLTHLRPDSGV